MTPGEWFRPKSEEELRGQLRTTQEELGVGDTESSLVPPSMKPKDVLAMPVEEIKKKYARRYEIYLDLLRDKRYGEKTGDVQLWEKDLEEMRKWLKALNALDSYIDDHKNGEKHTLREQQFTVFENLRGYLESGGTEGYIKLPTGVGKTVLFVEFIEALDLRTLIVVPTQILIGQTEEKIEQFAPDLDVGKVYAGAHQYNRHVTITTYDSFVNQVRSKKIKPEEYDCVILDEAHVSLSEQRMKAVQKFDKAVKIGFTATPEFSSRKKVGDLLETEIHRMDIREAVEEGLLCSLSAIVAKTEVDVSSVEVNKQGEYDQEKLEKAVNIAGRNKAAVDLYKESFAGNMAVAYCVGIKHAQAVSAKFNEEGIPAAHISGKMSPKVQESILKKFKTGEVKVLCNADILIAGFDEPKASVCLNLRPTKSRVVAEQRAGRVLRLNPADENKHAYVVDFLDKGIDPQQKPVLFASIIDGVFIQSRSRQTGNTGRGGEHDEIPIIDVPGLQIVTDVEEVMRIIRENGTDRKKEEYLSLDQLKEDVLSAGIKSSLDYFRQVKNHGGWPANPYVFYKDKWPGWKVFLGKERPYLNFEQLQSEVRMRGIKSSSDYKRNYKKHPGWPSEPHIQYKEWPGWEIFLTGEVKTFLDFDSFKKEVKENGIKTLSEYNAEYRSHKGWPSSPQTYYKSEWTGWSEILADKLLGFEQLQDEVREAGIKSGGQYILEYIKHPGWPSNPSHYYKPWPGWDALFGRERRERLSFEQLKAEVRDAGIRGVEHYRAEYKNHPGWPSNPFQAYEEWPGWPVFLGKVR